MKKFKHSEITPEKIYHKRRSFIKSMGYGLGALTLSSVPIINARASNLNEPTSYEDITTYKSATHDPPPGGSMYMSLTISLPVCRSAPRSTQCVRSTN